MKIKKHKNTKKGEKIEEKKPSFTLNLNRTNII